MQGPRPAVESFACVRGPQHRLHSRTLVGFRILGHDPVHARGPVSGGLALPWFGRAGNHQHNYDRRAQPEWNEQIAFCVLLNRLRFVPRPGRSKPNLHRETCRAWLHGACGNRRGERGGDRWCLLGRTSPASMKRNIRCGGGVFSRSFRRNWLGAGKLTTTAAFLADIGWQGLNKGTHTRATTLTRRNKGAVPQPGE